MRMVSTSIITGTHACSLLPFALSLLPVALRSPVMGKRPWRSGWACCLFLFVLQRTVQVPIGASATLLFDSQLYLQQP